MYYLIKKTNFLPKPIAIRYGGIFLPVLYIFMAVIMLAIVCLDAGYIHSDAGFSVVMVPCLGIFLIYGIFMFKEVIKLKKVKNFKYTGGGIVKKAKITSIKKTWAKAGRRMYIDVYYFEAEDSGMTYYSNGSSTGALLGTSIDKLQLLYAKYGFTYDEKQSQKEALLKRLDELIAEKEYEIENSGIVSKITKSKKSAELKIDKTTVSLGYIPTYWQIDDKKVTVGDTVDVYVDPDKPERYWVDTDFLF